MAYEFIKTSRDEGIVRIIFNRPKHNMLNIPMMKELCTEFDALSKDAELKGIVLSGEGPSFCAGVDVGDHKPDVVEEMIEVFNRMFITIHDLEVPLIAAVHGACLGGGMEVAIACDIILATRSAIFGQPEIKLAFFPPYAAIRLPRLVGVAKAMEICLTGKRYSAEEACRLGLVSHVVDEDKFNEALDALLGEIKTSSPLIIRLNKRAIKENLDRDFLTALRNVGDLFLHTLMKTEDTQEGIRSYFEKRKPQWKNR